MPCHKCKFATPILAIALTVVIAACSEAMDPFFPGRSSYVDSFVDVQAEFDALADQIQHDPRFMEIYCDGDYREGRASEDSPLVAFDQPTMEDYEETCGAVNFAYFRETSRGVMFYYTYFDQSDIRLLPSWLRLNPDAEKVSKCAPILLKASSGTCDFELRDNWVLNYKWEPIGESDSLPE